MIAFINFREVHHIIALMCNLTMYTISFRDHATDVLFEDEGEDQPLPVCILEALLKVHTYGAQHRHWISNFTFFHHDLPVTIVSQNCPHP